MNGRQAAAINFVTSAKDGSGFDLATGELTNATGIQDVQMLKANISPVEDHYFAKAYPYTEFVSLRQSPSVDSSRRRLCR